MPKRLFIIFIATLILLVHSDVKAVSNSNYINFNVESKFQASDSAEVSSVLVKTAPNLYFYVEKSWWDMQTFQKQNEILLNLEILSNEFNGKIYPTLTSIFGQEWRPGVDGDTKITILFHLMKQGIGGYFRSSDEYIKLQIPDSNEREMLYLPIADIDKDRKSVV